MKSCEFVHNFSFIKRCHQLQLTCHNLDLYLALRVVALSVLLHTNAWCDTRPPFSGSYPKDPGFLLLNDERLGKSNQHLCLRLKFDSAMARAELELISVDNIYRLNDQLCMIVMPINLEHLIQKNTMIPKNQLMCIFIALFCM